jgi:hypothetical protein
MTSAALPALPLKTGISRCLLDNPQQHVTDALIGYIRVLMRALAKIATPKQHTIVLLLRNRI